MVIECACGMVMSIATGELRRHCIRCGSVSLQAMEVGLYRNADASRDIDRHDWHIPTRDAIVHSHRLLLASCADGSDI
jgi:hypothetical protein